MRVQIWFLVPVEKKVRWFLVGDFRSRGLSHCSVAILWNLGLWVDLGWY